MIALEREQEREPETVTLAAITSHDIVQAEESKPLTVKSSPSDPARNSEQVPGAEKRVERMVFVAWLATLWYERIPKTQKELAKQLGVRESTLSHWKADGALEEANAIIERNIIGDRHAAIIRAISDKAESGDVQAFRAYMEFIVKRARPATVEVNTSGPTQINIAEMVRETEKVDALPGWLQEQIGSGDAEEQR